jgi:hypothetical protein
MASISLVFSDEGGNFRGRFAYGAGEGINFKNQFDEFSPALSAGF